MDRFEDENKEYFLDVESGAEMARLLNQDDTFTQAMGGLFSERGNDFTGIRRVLDIGCGPGGWVLGVASQHPHIDVYGFDISETMIAYAKAQTHVRGLHNAHFQVADATQRFPFEDASFDLVNIRFLVGFLPARAWSTFVAECTRVLRPGGIFRYGDTECGTSTSYGLETMMHWLVQASHTLGKTFAPDGRSFGTSAVLQYFLREAGYQDIQMKMHVMEYSAGTPYHDALCDDWRKGFQLAKPFFLKTGVTTEDEFDSVYRQMEIEMDLPTFCAVYYMCMAFGTKPK